MDHEAAVSRVTHELEALIHLHRIGLSGSSGYQARKKRMEDFILSNQIDITKDLDPVTAILYRRYFSQ